MTEAIVPSSPQIIVARGSLDYRWRRLLIVVGLFGYGLWSAYDGYIRMPRENHQFQQQNPGTDLLPHPGYDIPFNIGFGIGLPPLSLLYLAWVLYASRGSYRFDGATLSVPGHPEIPVNSIQNIDRSKWDRKGIAYLYYQPAGSQKLVAVKLDDFVYQRQPTDLIFEEIEKTIRLLSGPAESEPSNSEADTLGQQ